MRFLIYLKERLYQVCILLFVIITTEIFLFTVRGSLWIGVYLAITGLFSWLLISFLEYFRKKQYFLDITEKMQQLDKKYYIAEMLKRGKRQEEILNNGIFWEVGKSMAEQVNGYKFANQEYKEYIELWIHEVKIPIAAGKMIIENHRNEITEDIEEELNKVEDYTEQALFYARSNYVEKDYFIHKIKISDVVHTILIQNKKVLIKKKAKLELHDLDTEVFSDSKWLAFILNQILSNSIKYADKESLLLEIYTKQEKENIKLFLRDNGIGIPEAELSRVFEKGFTGGKGREPLLLRKEISYNNYRNKATGIGLYLCRELCHKLGYRILIESQESIGTTVCIIFPKGSIMNVLEI